MIKTIKIGKQDVVLDNNIGWTIVYRDQFGQDIIPSIMPMFASAMDIISGIAKETDGDGDEIALKDILKLTDGESLINALIHLGSFEFVDFINITWALAKNADDSIPEPKIWVKQFDEFPVDVIGPEVVKLIFKGMVSSKNLKRLDRVAKAVRSKKKSTSTPSSSQESNED